MVERKPISELPANSVKLITATQVATSVSNIVKELVENSLDAGSTVVRVKLENSGLAKVEVIDNGSGVGKEDVMKMALPHYTSKISQHQDIETLTTYGFRGEALSSICAVAKLAVTTKTAEDAVAATYTMNSDGDVEDVKPSHLSQGTLVVITSLFWNVPVRKQYYQTPKRKKEELTKVEDLLLNYGLIHPELHLSLHHDHSLVWQKSRAGSFKANILQTLGHSVCSHMEFLDEDEHIQMILMVPKRNAPVDLCFRHRPDRCFTFINQRPVISKDIEKLMKELYGFVQDPNQKSILYPVFIVSLQFPGDEVDVNVEPNKSKVFLKRQGDVMEFIKCKVGRVLGNDPPLADKGTEIDFQLDDKCTDTPVIDSDQVNEVVAIVEETVMETQRTRGSESNVQAQLETTFDQLRPQFESTCVDNSNIIVVDDEFFHGFNEPFDMPSTENKDKATPEQVPVVRIGSDEWSKGLVTNSDGRIVHPVEVFRGQPLLAKRVSDPSESGNLAKKPKLVETEEASRIIGSQSSLLETVNGRVRKIPVDPFGEYCKEVRSEMLSQNPLMSFTELTQNLNHGWRNLDKNSREKYESKADANKQRYNENKLRTPRTSVMSNTSLDRYLLGSQTPVIRADKPVPSLQVSGPPSARPVFDIDFSLDILNRSLESYQPPPQEQWISLKKMKDNVWLCSNTREIMAVNFTRLYELILYSQLVIEHVVPSRPVKSPILIDKNTLGNAHAWRKLMSFSTERETATTQIITDPRVTANGVGIRLGVDSEEAGVVVYQVPANVNVFDINDVKNFLLKVTKDDSTVENCRPKQTVVNLKMEASRLAAERCTEPDESEVCELLSRWLSTGPENVCLHGEPVVWSYVIDNPDCEYEI